MSEIVAALHQSTDVVERALSDLQNSGRIIIREGYCADPHLESVDLRVVGLIAPAEDGSDAQSRAIVAIDGVWTAWLGDYLGSHRCG